MVKNNVSKSLNFLGISWYRRSNRKNNVKFGIIDPENTRGHIHTKNKIFEKKRCIYDSNTPRTVLTVAYKLKSIPHESLFTRCF